MNNSLRHTGRKAGFSLIEILVVLAILVIGVLGVLRIFPYGFLAIQRTGEQTNASALANQQLETEKNAVTVPESIVAIQLDKTGTIATPDPDVLPDDLNPVALDLSNPNVLTSDVNKFRYVIGETFRIPIAFSSPVSTAANYGAVYLAQFGPIYFNPNQVTPGSADPLNPQVTGAPLQRVEQIYLQSDGSESAPNLTSSAQYAIDYAAGKIAFYPRTGTAVSKRAFQFNYTYYTTAAGSPATKTILSGTNKIIVPDIVVNTGDPAPLPIWQDIFNKTAPVTNALPADFDMKLGIKRSSEEVSRAFALVAAPGAIPAWSNDPYEYAIYSNSSANNGTANVGVFLFNPIGRNATIATVTGTQPFSARINYQIYDNHIIRDQRSMPSTAPYDVRLSLPFVSTVGDKELDQSDFQGLFGNNLDPAMLIYNANNGQLITAGSGECLPGTTPLPGLGNNDNFTVDAKTGVVHFDSAFVTANNLQNATLRIYYHTQKNFGQQIQKANAHYYAATSQANLPYNNYFVPATGTRIYFPNCELGKSVTIGSLNYKDGAGNVQHTSGETFQIVNTGGVQPYVDIKSLHGDALNLVDPADAALGLNPVDNVRGVSMKARVIWLRSVQLNDPAKPVYHWRKVDNDTILTPNYGN